LEAITRAEHARREHVRRQADAARNSDPVGVRSPADDTEQAHLASPVGNVPDTAVAGSFGITLFARICPPALERRNVYPADLVKLLTTFVQIAEKKQARCWSPTRYVDGATSRGNAGVDAVSALVFDLDRVPPDRRLLNGVCWIGHTTWSHRPEAPRWRVVI